MENGKWLSAKNKFLLLCSCSLFILSGHFYYPSDKFNHNTAAQKKLNSGDIIFRKGTGFWSPFFSTLNSKTGYSHVGVISKENDKLYVIHSDADDLTIKGGVQKVVLEKFIEEASAVEYMKNKMPAKIKIRFLENIYMGLNKKIPFDDSFDVHDNGVKLYCTEFLWRAALNSGVRFGNIEVIAGKDLITVDSIYRSNLLSNF